MRSWIYNLKFRNQIIIIFSGILFFICVLSGVAFYYLSSQNIKDNFVKSAEDSVIQIEDTLETRIGIIEGKCKSMLINQTFYNTLSQGVDNFNVNTVAETVDVIEGYISDFEYGEDLISSSYLYTDYNDYYSYIHYRVPEFDFKNSILYQQCMEQDPSNVCWIPPVEDVIIQGNSEVIPCVRRFTTGKGQDKWVYFVYQLSKKSLEELVTGQRNFFDEIIILDQKGNAVLGEDKQLLTNVLDLWEKSKNDNQLIQEKTESDGKNYLVESCNIEMNGWTLLAVKSEEELLKSLYELGIRISLVIAAVMAIGISLMLWISKRLTEGLSRLEKQMNYVQRGELKVHFFYPYTNEIGSLTKAFNYMLDELQKMIQKRDRAIEELKIERNRVEEVQKQKRKAELKALQAQINPHLLYNTLNAITWETAEKGMTDASILASSLGSFFRLSLSKGAEIISVGEEIEHVRSYLKIQGIRYKDKLKYDIQAAEYLKDYRIIKLVLQPLVENSIYHGIKEKDEGGIIRVRVTKRMTEGRDDIELEVWDNGVGIKPDKLRKINENLRQGRRDEGKGYGIFNVNERIMLYFGDAYGLRYESREGEYTRAILLVPAIRGDDSV